MGLVLIVLGELLQSFNFSSGLVNLENGHTCWGPESRNWAGFDDEYKKMEKDNGPGKDFGFP